MMHQPIYLSNLILGQACVVTPSIQLSLECEAPETLFHWSDVFNLELDGQKVFSVLKSMIDDYISCESPLLRWARAKEGARYDIHLDAALAVNAYCD